MFDASAFVAEGAFMGILDKAKGLVGEHEEQVKEGIDKAADVADEKTGGKHTDAIEGAADKAKEAVDKVADSD